MRSDLKVKMPRSRLGTRRVRSPSRYAVVAPTAVTSSSFPIISDCRGAARVATVFSCYVTHGQVDNPSAVTGPLVMPQQFYGWLQPKQDEMYRSFVPVGPGGRTCEETIEEPTVFVTRFEYHNLFHISTDWWVTAVVWHVLRRLRAFLWVRLTPVLRRRLLTGTTPSLLHGSLAMTPSTSCF